MLNYTTFATITPDQLDFWFKNGRNVLIYGDHGVGKTSIIRNYWDSLGIKYKIFSGATLDPWTDLVGIPSKTVEGDNTYIDYALPRTMSEDLEAIFIDEINRAPAKVRNALLELLLTGSINGRKFPKLKAIWAAANPRDSENDYDVEELDPAQEDRFHVIIKLSDEPQLSYFAPKYGRAVADRAINWHSDLPDEIRRHISPRRLDFAMEYVLNMGGNARDILPYQSINVTQFTKAIKGDERLKKLAAILDSGEQEKIKEFFADSRNVQACLRDILKSYRFSKELVENYDIEELMGICEAEPKLALLMAESHRDDKKQALLDYRAVNGVDPDWHCNGNTESSQARSATALFDEEIQHFPNPDENELKIPILAELLSLKEAYQILGDFKSPKGIFIQPTDEGSAVNGIDFAVKVFADKDAIIQMQTPELEKFYSILFSSINYFYERDGNLIGMAYEVPKSLTAVRPIPRQIKKLPIASFAMPKVTASGRKVTSKQSNVRVREESL